MYPGDNSMAAYDLTNPAQYVAQWEQQEAIRQEEERRKKMEEEQRKAQQQGGGFFGKLLPGLASTALSFIPGVGQIAAPLVGGLMSKLLNK